jgi:hypothetical protein
MHRLISGVLCKNENNSLKLTATQKAHPMRSFDDLFAISAERKGGTNALEALITKP